eukprot:CAMPEP_0201502792 /NCGR_PEP_ID=MMETSP0151_2-20130828/84324_1 /ASSEMBLY_ACC=CAM_ASM_000257 /TAXON_ID=200890 /ORGANISM="Paramoeba atlantica, Strain 621/1 / CCAP 1560/9" /LENGTH=824 /DNA_ID=CAMNT_0047896415 /DNA_START=102 /DNA_END=2576 /DNA_ORIENTATION=+
MTKDLQKALMLRLIKGMTPQQKEVLESACSCYVITQIEAENPTKMRALREEEEVFQWSPKGELHEKFLLFYKSPLEVPVLVKATHEEKTPTQRASKKIKVDEARPSIFGAHILSICRKPKTEKTWHYPPMIDQTIQHIREKGLKTEGVFRISASTKALDDARKDIDQGRPISNLETHESIELCAAILKVFLRELEEPLCTYAFYDPMLYVARAEITEDRREFLYKELCNMLPEPNRPIIMKLLALLAEIHPQEEINKMSPLNLAVTIGPSICKRKEADMMTEMADMGDHNKAFEAIIKNGGEISSVAELDLKFYACAFVKSGSGSEQFPDGSLLMVCRRDAKGDLDVPEQGNGMPKYGTVFCENPLTGAQREFQAEGLEPALDASFEPAPRRYILQNVLQSIGDVTSSPRTPRVTSTDPSFSTPESLRHKDPKDSKGDLSKLKKESVASLSPHVKRGKAGGTAGRDKKYRSLRGTVRLKKKKEGEQEVSPEFLEELNLKKEKKEKDSRLMDLFSDQKKDDKEPKSPKDRKGFRMSSKASVKSDDRDRFGTENAIGLSRSTVLSEKSLSAAEDIYVLKGIIRVLMMELSRHKQSDDLPENSKKDNPEVKKIKQMMEDALIVTSLGVSDDVIIKWAFDLTQKGTENKNEENKENDHKEKEDKKHHKEKKEDSNPKSHRDSHREKDKKDKKDKKEENKEKEEKKEEEKEEHKEENKEKEKEEKKEDDKKEKKEKEKEEKEEKKREEKREKEREKEEKREKEKKEKDKKEKEKKEKEKKEKDKKEKDKEEKDDKKEERKEKKKMDASDRQKSSSSLSKRNRTTKKKGK